MKNSLVLGFILSFILIISLPVWGIQQMMQILKQIHRVVIHKLQVGIHQRQQTPTLEDKQTQQQAQLHLLPMGQMYPVNSANSPSYSAMSQDVCSMGVSGSLLLLALAYLGANI